MVSGVFFLPRDASATRRRAGIDTGFLGGAENHLARRCHERLANGDDHFADEGPIVLWGPSGHGKSLLLEALAAAWKSRHGDQGVQTTNGNDFARAYEYAVKIDGISEFREKMGQASLLVIDDIHQLVNKTAAQQQLVLLLNELESILPEPAEMSAAHAAGCRWADQPPARVLVASSQPPHRLALIPSLTSRLAGGVLIPLQPLGPEVRREACRSLASKFDVELTDAIADLFAEDPEFATTFVCVPKIQQAMLGLKQAMESGFDPSELKLVRAYLLADSPQPPSLDNITAAVARRFRLKTKELKSPTRRQGIVEARGIAIYLARQLTSKTLDQLGRFFGGRDHSTILHAYRKVESRIGSDEQLRHDIDELRDSMATISPA